MALLEDKGFTASHFRAFHPGGKLGAQIKHAKNIMHIGDELPLVLEGVKVEDAIIIMSKRKFGCIGVVNASGHLTGIVTDGDLRRHIGPHLASQNIETIMSRDPKTIGGEMLAGEIIEMINARRITAVFVVENAKPIGLVHIHDLLAIGAG